jgi:hypothetical protein
MGRGLAQTRAPLDHALHELSAFPFSPRFSSLQSVLGVSQRDGEELREFLSAHDLTPASNSLWVCWVKKLHR